MKQLRYSPLCWNKDQLKPLIQGDAENKTNLEALIYIPPLRQLSEDVCLVFSSLEQSDSSWAVINDSSHGKGGRLVWTAAPVGGRPGVLRLASLLDEAPG